MLKIRILNNLLVSHPSSMKVMDRQNAQLDAHCRCLATGQQVWCLMVCRSVKFQDAITLFSLQYIYHEA